MLGVGQPKNSSLRRLGDANFVSRFILVSGLLLLPLQFVKISIAQPVHLWLIVTLVVLSLMRSLPVTGFEAVIYLLFITFALFDTYGTNYERVKDSEQVLKFVLIYPGFFLVGRWIGTRFAKQPLPFGLLFLLGFLAIQYVVQSAEIPILWERVSFMEGSLYGTFKERNWLAVYFFGLSYLIFLKERPTTFNSLKFFLFCLLVTALSNSKSVMVACGIVLLIRIRGRYAFKLVTIIAGAYLYAMQFSNELSEGAVQNRLDHERGLAFSESVRLLGENIFGYGFGFVESYFSKYAIGVQGLGAGVNSVFSAPLDLFLIAGPVGLLCWAVFFAGLGVRSVGLLAPFAAWSLLAPLHQSEISYLFSGILVSWGLAGRAARSKIILRSDDLAPAPPSRMYVLGKRVGDPT